MLESEIIKYPFLQPEIPSNSGPVTLKSKPSFLKVSSLAKYWSNPDKFIALVVAGSGLLCATLFGSVVFSIGLGLPLACYLSYKRSNTDVYTNFRFLLNDLYCYPKYLKQVVRLLQSSHEEISEPHCALSKTVETKISADFFTPQKDVSLVKNEKGPFPMHILLLAKALNPYATTKIQVAGYICVEHINTACDDNIRIKVEALLSEKNLSPKDFLSKFKEYGLHHDFLKRKRKDLYAYIFGNACLLRDVVVKPEFRGNGLGQVLVAHAIQKLKKMADVDVLICKRNEFIEHKLMPDFFGRFYTPPDFCVNNDSLHPVLRTETIFFPIYKKKMEYACEKALEKFLMFERLKKNTVPYFSKLTEQTNQRVPQNEQYTVAVRASEDPSL